MNKLFRFIASNLIFFVGFAFIFVAGLFYAFLKDAGTLVTVIFLAMVIGWIVFFIKYFWEEIDKRKKV